MAKQQRKESNVNNKSNISDFSFNKFIPEKFQTPAFLLLLLILILIFFSPVMFGDKTTNSGDLIQVKSLREYSSKDRDGYSLWNPHIFCGMPAVVTSAAPRMFDLTAAAYSVVSRVYSSAFTDYNAIYTFSFVILAFTAFFFMRSFGASRSLSFIAAAATAFSTGITLFFYIGHVSKLMSVAVFPFILMMLFKFQKEIKLLDVLLFVLGMHLLVLTAHVQIVFYFVLVSTIYFLFYFIYSLITKNSFLQKQLFKSAGITIAVTVIALLMSFDSYSQILEYKPYSTRGTKSAAELQKSQADADKAAYAYATNWSFSPQELITFIVPSYYGFGRSTYKGELTQNQEYEAHTYFGQMESVDVAMYMGIIIFALGLFALLTDWRKQVIQFFGIVIVLFILMSFGKNFPLVYNIFYNTIPQFDNFRAPSMSLVVVQLIFPVLAGFGIMKIISLRESRNPKFENAFKYLAIGFAALLFFSLILGGSITSWFTARVNEFASTLGENESQYFKAFAGYMSDMFRSDLQIALLLLALTFGISYAYITSKINKRVFVVAVTLFVLFDLFRISTRGAGYVDKEQINQLFNEPQYISTIKQQNDKEPFRMINLKQQGMGTLSNNANLNVYFLQEDFYGYSAAKPRSYQNIMEVVGPVNMTLWRMLGVKYVVVDQQFGAPGFTPIQQSEQETVYKNEKALPRIYFVENVEQKNDNDVLNLIKSESFDPKKTAFVEKLNFSFDKADSSSQVKIVEYKDELVSAEVDAKGNNFLFFGTTYLPGWKAFVDNKQIAVHKTNTGFQGIVVPSGKHKVEFVYDPSGFTFGKYLSLILNFALFAAIGLVIFFNKKKGAVETDK